MKRIPALDGWRGVAILLVLIDHLQWQWFGHPFRPWVETGQHGVTLFFVLSGYLITSNLIERKRPLGEFYARRFFRLMPVAWAYLVALAVIGLLYPAQAMRQNELIACVLFYRNYLHSNALLSAPHFWSLSIEEQFYILWPATLMFLGKKRSCVALAAVALAVVFTRNYFWSFYHRDWYNYRTEVRADALCIGCLAAILLSYPSIRKWVRAALPALYIPSAAVFAYCVVAYQSFPPAVECCAAAVLVTGCVVAPETLSARALSAAPISWLGRISYSVYVWQQFIHTNYGISGNLLVDCISLALILASYYAIERPSQKLSHSLLQLSPVNS
jgi:peptidoglycan/LPS O-acetylase OafA/YrhL